MGKSGLRVEGAPSIAITPNASVKDNVKTGGEEPFKPNTATTSPAKKINPVEPVITLGQNAPLLHISSGLKRPLPSQTSPAPQANPNQIQGTPGSAGDRGSQNNQNNTGSGYQSAASRFQGNESSVFFSAKGDLSTSGAANMTGIQNRSGQNNILVGDLGTPRDDERDPEDQTMYSAVSGNNSAFYSAQPSRFVSAFGDNNQRLSTQDTTNILAEMDAPPQTQNLQAEPKQASESGTRPE